MRASAMPGIRLSLLKIRFACWKLAARFGPADLNVDGRRRAEIQDLADDVGWQKAKLIPGNWTGSSWRSISHVLLGWTMAFLQLDLDVGVLRARSHPCCCRTC
mgnify:CR=1 FL=1